MTYSLLTGFLVLASWNFSPARAQVQASVAPTVETDVPSNAGDADDVAIWVHPTRREESLVIGTYKDTGLAVYDLGGNVLQFLREGLFNNVDVRYAFPLGRSRVALVTAGEQGENELAIYAVDRTTRTLRDVAARPIELGIAIYGSCMYRSRVTQDYYFFGNSKDGAVEQWRLFPVAGGLVDAVRVRTFDVGAQVEGCVADDENGFFFIAEEDVGLWRFGAEPNAGSARTMVDSTSGNLTADVEGLAIYYASGGGGYLIASSQGNDAFVVYDRRPPHAHRLTFHIGSNDSLGIDEVTHSDGIEAINLGLGSRFPGGAFIAHDGENAGSPNFKLVPWASIANAAVPPLVVDTTYDPFAIGCQSASWQYRNGSGVNPNVLVKLYPESPQLGTTWEVELDCSGHDDDEAHLWVARPAQGVMHPFGEVLVDRSSRVYVHLVKDHDGDEVTFRGDIPPVTSLCGLVVTLQGLCEGDPGPRLSNAIDLRIGQ